MDREYENRERALLHAQLAAIEKAPLGDRREARTEWAQALKDPVLIGQRVSWLIDGCYGYGAYRNAHDIVTSPHRNRVAALGVLIAALEWQCPNIFARQAFERLAQAESAAVNAAIQTEIDTAIAAQAERRTP